MTYRTFAVIKVTGVGELPDGSIGAGLSVFWFNEDNKIENATKHIVRVDECIEMRGIAIELNDMKEAVDKSEEATCAVLQRIRSKT